MTHVWESTNTSQADGTRTVAYGRGQAMCEMMQANACTCTPASPGAYNIMLDSTPKTRCTHRACDGVARIT